MEALGAPLVRRRPAKVRLLTNRIGKVSPMRNPVDGVYFLARRSSSDTSGRCAAPAWSREETTALVDFVALYWEGAHTPTDGRATLNKGIFHEFIFLIVCNINIQ